MWPIHKQMVSVAAIGVMLAAAACGGPSGGQPTSPANGTLNIGVANIPTTLDPGQNFQREQLGILKLTGGTLTEVSQDGKQITMGLAASVETSDIRYVVKLKPDLKFSDGSALTAKDVVASFEHYIADDTNGAGYSFTSIKKVTAVDELTVDFDLKQPAPALEWYLSQPQSAIIPAKSIEARDSKELYTGDPLPTAGQFQIDAYDESRITLKANPQYSGPQPSTKTLVFMKIGDTAARLAQVKGGQIDYADEIGPKQGAQMSAPVEMRTARSVNGLNILTMNNRDNSVLSDVRIRQAIAVAVDREQINTVAFAGQSSPTLGFFPDSSQYSEPFLPKTADLGRAKELLAGTSCGNGCKLKLLVESTFETLGDSAIVIQQNLRTLGIDVSIEKVDGSTQNNRTSKGDYDLSVSYTYDMGDFPDGLFAYLLGPGNQGYRTGYLSPDMNQLIDTASSANGSARETAIHQVFARFEKDLPWAPLNGLSVVSASRVPAELFDVDPNMFYHVR